MAFTDYAFYKSKGGKLTESQYNEVFELAYAEILSQTLGRAENCEKSMQNSVKLCECELVDLIYAYRNTSDMIPKGVTSVNNDGFSVSVQGTVTEVEAKERKAICSRWLQVPINLMCRWV